MKERISGTAAVGIGVGLILGWDAICPRGETFSEGVDKYIDRHPVLTRAVIGYTALHLINYLPESLDLFHQATQLKPLKRVKEIIDNYDGS